MNNMENDIPKYRKASSAKGRPRSKHKHFYETVLLLTPLKLYDGKWSIHKMPTKVCAICGRIDETDDNPIYYVNNGRDKYHLFSHELSRNVEKLLVYYVEDAFDKDAKPVDFDPPTGERLIELLTQGELSHDGSKI